MIFFPFSLFWHSDIEEPKKEEPKHVWTSKEENFITLIDGTVLDITNDDSRILSEASQWYFEGHVIVEGREYDQFYLPTSQVKSLFCRRKEFRDGVEMPFGTERE